MVANFRMEAIAVYPALDLMQRKPFLGFADNIVRSNLVHSTFGVWFAVWAQVQVQVLGQKQWWAKLLRLLTVNSLSYFVKIKY
jgi:hypothetical protein